MQSWRCAHTFWQLFPCCCCCNRTCRSTSVPASRSTNSSSPNKKKKACESSKAIKNFENVFSHVNKFMSSFTSSVPSFSYIKKLRVVWQWQYSVVIHLSNFIKNYKIAIVIIYNFFYWPKKIKQKSTPTTNFSIYLSII